MSVPSATLFDAAFDDLAGDLASAFAKYAPEDALRRLAAAGADRLPYPGAGGGATLARWRALAAAGARDLSFAKLFEGHTDALAILAEAGMAQLAPAGSVWGTWCAEPPNARLRLEPAGDGWILYGRKAWCSGARSVSHAIVSCWTPAGEAMLAAVDMRQGGIAFDDDGWRAVGMRASSSIDVHFAGVAARPVGGPGLYVGRAGFWHGGAGVAACWHGAAARLAAVLQAQLAARPGDPHRLAQLGQVAVALNGSAAMLREAAAAIDRAPAGDAMALALSVRLAVEAAATLTLAAVGRALGAGPLCKDAAIARLFADLPVFMRQSHAERDQAALGTALAAGTDAPWRL